MKRLTLATIALMFVFGGCASPKKVEAAKSTASAVPSEPPPAYRVNFATTKGAYTVQVYRPWGPNASDRLYQLVNSKFYDGVRFHRVIKKFVAQWGINPDPKTNSMWRMLKIPDDPQTHKNTRGTIAFAMNGPGTRSTQVFINLADNAMLDGQGFVPFGEVIDGMDVVDRISALYGDVAPFGAGPNPTKIELVGNQYLDREFPRLDGIKTARVSMK